MSSVFEVVLFFGNRLLRSYFLSCIMDVLLKEPNLVTGISVKLKKKCIFIYTDFLYVQFEKSLKLLWA